MDPGGLCSPPPAAVQRFLSGDLQPEQRMTGNRTARLPRDEEKEALIEDFQTRNAKKFRGLLGPFEALEALEQGLTADIETDIRRDVELFGECAVSAIAKNLIGVFLNTRAAGRHPRIKGIEPAKIRKVAMSGGGVRVRGLSMCCSRTASTPSSGTSTSQPCRRGWPPCAKHSPIRSSRKK